MVYAKKFERNDDDDHDRNDKRCFKPSRYNRDGINKINNASEIEILSQSSKDANQASSCVQPKAIFTIYMQISL